MTTPNLYHRGKSPVVITGWNAKTKLADIKLYSTRSDNQVYWSNQGNSYVLIPADDEGYTSWFVGDRVWLTQEEKRVYLLSINGGGEARWSVPYSGSTAGDLDAAVWFGLTCPVRKVET